MDRRLLFPVMAVSALAQTTSPASAEAEKALRARAEQFYQLEVDGKFRQAEAFVAEDSKDYYFNNGKPRILGFKIPKIEFTDSTHAVVTLLARSMLIAPGVPPQEIPATGLHTWKFENGEWSWYIDQTALGDTPFGKMKPGIQGNSGGSLPIGMPDFSKPENLVSVDKKLVDLSSGPGKVTITNHLPGAITLDLGKEVPHGLVVEIDKKQLGSEEKAEVVFRVSDEAKPNGKVRIAVSPLGLELNIQVTSK